MTRTVHLGHLNVMRTYALYAGLLLAALLAGARVHAAAKEKKPMSLYDLTTNTLEGKPAPLSVYKGKVTLVVNTASECGFTPQYEGLEKLYEQYQAKGFVVLGFPSNDFGGQEPGSPQQIATFCETRYHVRFPLFEKVKTKGDGQSPVYAFLTSGFDAPKWNFHKFLVGKDGKVRRAWPSKVTPESAEIKGAIEAALAE